MSGQSGGVNQYFIDVRTNYPTVIFWSCDNTCMWLNAGSKVQSNDRDTKKRKLKMMPLEVDSACDASSGISRCLSRKSAGVHGHTSKLYDELLVNVMLNPH